MSENNLFEKTDIWENYDDKETVKSKIPLIEKMIPSDVSTILDVGCGNGIITNHLDKNYEVTGLDSSEKALSYVTAKTLQNNITDVQLEDASFDLVLCSEVLEHLNDVVLAKAVGELKRLSKKYILITVPHDEYLDQTNVKCRSCGHIFHAYEHVQTFRQRDLELLFSEYKLKETFVDGPTRIKYNPLLLKIRQKVGDRYFHPPKGTAYCNKCENTEFATLRGNLTSKSCNLLNRIIGGKEKYWIFCLFEKSE